MRIKFAIIAFTSLITFSMTVPSNALSMSTNLPQLPAHIRTSSFVTTASYVVSGWHCVNQSGDIYPTAFFQVTYWRDRAQFGQMNSDRLYTGVFENTFEIRGLDLQTTYNASISCSGDGMNFSDETDFEFSTMPRPVSTFETDGVYTNQIFINCWSSTANWDDPILSYKIEMSSDEGVTWQSQEVTHDRGASFYPLVPGSIYDFRCAAISKGGQGEYSELKGVRTKPLPNKPSLISKVHLTPTDFSHWELKWNRAKSTSEEDIYYSYTYRINRTKNWSSWKKVGTSLQTEVSRLTIGKKYEFRIRAINSIGESISDTFKIRIRKFSTPKNPGNFCEVVNETHELSNGNFLICGKADRPTWLLYSSKNWPPSRMKALNKILKQLKNEATDISKVVFRYDQSSIAVASLQFEKSLEILSRVDSMPKGISHKAFKVKMKVLKSEADWASWCWFNSDIRDARDRYREILVALNKIFTKLNPVLGTTYQIPYVAL